MYSTGDVIRSGTKHLHWLIRCACNLGRNEIIRYKFEYGNPILPATGREEARLLYAPLKINTQRNAITNLTDRSGKGTR